MQRRQLLDRLDLLDLLDLRGDGVPLATLLLGARLRGTLFLVGARPSLCVARGVIASAIAWR